MGPCSVGTCLENLTREASLMLKHLNWKRTSPDSEPLLDDRYQYLMLGGSSKVVHSAKLASLRHCFPLRASQEFCIFVILKHPGQELWVDVSMKRGRKPGFVSSCLYPAGGAPVRRKATTRWTGRETWTRTLPGCASTWGSLAGSSTTGGIPTWIS